MKQYSYKRLSYDQIEKVIIGDAEAVTALIKLYMPYIKKLSYGDKDIEDRIISKLIRTVFQFRLDYQKPE